MLCVKGTKHCKQMRRNFFFAAQCPKRIDMGEESVVAKAPGMKYRHYAPKGQLYLIEGKRADVIATINQPGLRIIGTSPDKSRMDDSSPISHAPPSIIISILPQESAPPFFVQRRQKTNIIAPMSILLGH